MDFQEILIEPVREMWGKILSFLPNILGALVILLVGAIIARILQALVERALRIARFDTLTERAGINQALERGQIKASPSGIVARLFYWVILLLALVGAMNALNLTVATDLLNKLVEYVPNVIAAIFVLALGFFFGSVVRGFVQTVAGGVRVLNPETLGKIAQAAVIIFSVAAALEQLRIAATIVTNAFTLLFGALALGLALAFGLGCKDMVKDWVESITKK